MAIGLLLEVAFLFLSASLPAFCLFNKPQEISPTYTEIAPVIPDIILWGRTFLSNCSWCFHEPRSSTSVKTVNKIQKGG